MGQRFLTFVKTYNQHFRSYRHDVSDKARQYMCGLMQGGERKNMLHMAEIVPNAKSRNLQQFLTHSQWSARAVLDQVAREVNALVGHPTEACLNLDESSFAKQGKKSVGVARQWLGRLGKVDNGQVAVYGVLCQKQRAALVDTRLYLPKEWTDDPERCRDAGVPEEEIVFRTKEALAVEMIQHARKLGLQFGWVGADAGYGKSPALFYRLGDLGETFYINVPADFSVYLTDPRPQAKPRRRPGTGLRYATAQKRMAVRKFPELKDPAAWQKVTGRNTTRGKLALRAWRRVVYVWDGQSAQARRLTLVVTENLDGTDRKYTVTNAPETTGLDRMVFCQRQRYWIERTFQDGKGECGMADYQVQKWSGWQHHMALVMMALLFMLKERLEQRQAYPILSCADIEKLLARFLPQQELDESEVIRQVEAMHRLRQKAKRSHARCAKRRAKAAG